MFGRGPDDELYLTCSRAVRPDRRIPRGIPFPRNVTEAVSARPGPCDGDGGADGLAGAGDGRDSGAEPPRPVYAETMEARDIERRVRAICLSLPSATEKVSHGAPAFFVQRQFVMLWSDGHHDNRFPHLWCAAPSGAQESLIAAAPDKFFRPPYVGSRGWLGVRLDGRVDWDEVAMLCEEAYRAVAPRKLAALLDPQADSGAG